MPHSIEILLVLAVLVSAWTDLRTGMIPNWITVSAAVLGFALRCGFEGLNGAVVSLEGAVLGLGLFIVFYLAGGMGAGDVKLFGAVGAMAGPQSLVLIFVFTALLGGIAAGAVALRRRTLQSSLRYGAAIAAGTLISLLVVH